MGRLGVINSFLSPFHHCSSCLCVSWKRQANGLWWQTILALKEYFLFVFLPQLSGCYCYPLCRVGVGLGGRGKKKCKRPQRLFLAPFPSFHGISEGSEIAPRMVGIAPHSCPACLHPWLMLLIPFFVTPGTVCVCVWCSRVGGLTRNWAIILGRREQNFKKPPTWYTSFYFLF